MTVICWFRRVLRLDDHPALVAALTGQANTLWHISNVFTKRILTKRALREIK